VEALMRRVVVVVLDRLSDDQRAQLHAALLPGAELRQVEDDRAALETAVVLVSVQENVDRSLLTSAPALRAVVKVDSHGGVIDEQACLERGVAIHRVPMVSLISVAEHTVMVMLALEKQLTEAERRLRAGTVFGDIEPAITDQENYAYNWVGLERFEALYGRRVGLVGMGTVGRAVAERIRSFGAEIVASTRRPMAGEVESLGVRRVPFDELLATSDHVSLHIKFEPSNERLMGAREFGLMKKGAFFINTARGRLVDETALTKALKSGHLGGAALDVFWREPLEPDSPLRGAPRTILTPHTAGIPAGLLHPAELTQIVRVASSYIGGS
jgi:phosphoglycerate dehydrogenase-like enzyme